MDSISRRRRRVLSIVASGGAVFLAGCSGGGEEGNGNGNGASDDEQSNDESSGETDVEPDETVLVGPGGDLRFDPETLEVDPGTAVAFVWESDGHNVLLRDQPDDSDWNGENRAKTEGFTHVHTFEVEGRYEIYCGPHNFQGMEMEILVGDVETANGEDDD